MRNLVVCLTDRWNGFELSSLPWVTATVRVSGLARLLPGILDSLHCGVRNICSTIAGTDAAGELFGWAGKRTARFTGIVQYSC